jgi:hypothetical protein
MEDLKAVFSGNPSYMLSDKHQFALLKLGPQCNAATSHSFTEAKCYTDTVKEPNSSLTLTVAFTRMFSPGILLLTDYIQDKKHNLSDYQMNALQKLVGFLEDKGRPVTLYLV